MRRIWIAVVVTLIGCAGEGTGLDENGRPLGEAQAPLTATYASIQENVFTPICTRCHAGASAPVGLRLDTESSYAMLVNAASVEVPELKRVQPGNPNVSYLIQKLEGTAAIGDRMPLNLPPLPQTTIDVIRQWISEGAQPSVASDAPVPALTAIAPMPEQTLTNAPREILLASDVALDTTALHASSVTLTRSGGDGGFDEGNEIDLAPLHIEVRALEPTVIAIQLAANRWIADRYRLRVAGIDALAVLDREGRAIDGDRDGHPGGDFVTEFSVTQ